jgi:hypothetical protein
MLDSVDDRVYQCEQPYNLTELATSKLIALPY